MLPVLTCLVGPPINLTCGRIATGTGLSSSILSFVNRTTGWISALYFTIYECAAKDTSVDAFSASLSLHNYVDFLYHDSISHSHIILAGRCHITNLYWNNLARHMCTTWGTLASDSKSFCIPLQSDSTISSDPHKYILNFSMDQLTVDASPTNLCLDFSSGKTVDLKIKEIGRRRIPSRDLSNLHFPPSFYCAYNDLDSS